MTEENPVNLNAERIMELRRKSPLSKKDEGELLRRESMADRFGQARTVQEKDKIRQEMEDSLK